MKFTLLKRILWSGLTGFYRNRTVSLSSILILTVTLCIISSFYLFKAVFDHTLNIVKERVDVRVYFTLNATEEQIGGLKAVLEGMPEVKEVTYTSKDKVLSDFRERHSGDQLTLQALDELGANPFGASLSILAVDPGQYESIAKSLSERNDALGINGGYIDKINYYALKDSIDRLNNIISYANMIAFWLTVLFAGMSLMIVYNTIRLAIFVYRDEIAVMKLVGASNMFIRGPFIVEAILYAFMASIITIIIFYPATIWVTRKTVLFFEGLNIHNFFVSNVLELLIILLGSSILLASVSAILAVRKYLNV